MIGAATPDISPRGDDSSDDRFAQLLLVLAEQRTGLAGLVGVVDEDRPRYWRPMSKPCRLRVVGFWIAQNASTRVAVAETSTVSACPVS
jgi:hypothetical protein